MKRDETEKLTWSWDSEPQQPVHLSLTTTAWQLLEQQARQQGISCSQLVERYARMQTGSVSAGIVAATDSQAADGEAVGAEPSLELNPLAQLRQDKVRLQAQLAELEQAIAALQPNGGDAASRSLLEDSLSFSQDAAMALRAAEERLRLALEAAHMIVWDVDLTTNQVICSENARQVWGFHRGSREQFAKIFHPDDCDKIAAVSARALAGEAPFLVDYRLFDQQGELRWFSSRGQVYRSPEGEPQRVVGVSMDITDRKQTEQALRESEERFRAMFDQAAVGISQATLDGRFIQVNPALCQLTGYSREQLLQKTWQDITYPDDLDKDSQNNRLLLAGEINEYSIEKRYVHRDGSIIWVNLTSSVVRDADGQVKYTVGIVEDIRERQAALQARQQVEAERNRLLELEQAARAETEATQRQLEAIFETSPVGIGLLNADQQFIAINEALAEINGLSREQHLAQTIPELFSESDPTLVEVFRQIYATGTPFVSSSFAVNVPGRSDRRPGYYNVHYLPIRRSPVQVERVIVYVVDVTERSRLELAQQFLAESSKVLASSLDYQTTLTSIAELVVPAIADWCTIHIVEEAGNTRQLVVTHVNPEKVAWAKALHQRYPYDPDAPRGVANVIRMGASELYCDVPDQLLVEFARDAEHLQLLRSVGFSSVMIVPLSMHGRSLGAISFAAAESGRRYDQTDLALAEELGRRAALAVENARLYAHAQRDRTRAEAANRIKDEFLAILSHELRTPLNPILGWTKLLQSQVLDAQMSERALDIIERNAKLQAQLIEDLLDVSRILQGKLNLNVTRVDLRATIEAALETVRLSAQAKSIQLRTELAAVGTICGDANRLQQVVWNLLSNAIKFTPTGGSVKIRLTQVEVASAAPSSTPQSFAQVQVQDTGKGIRPEFLPFVFDYFRQADSSITRNFGGLGIGLAIVRHLVELHGGTVEADSRGEGLGALFTVMLPLQPPLDRPPQAVAAAASIPERLLHGIHVLAVDDEADNLELATFILEQAGATVTIAESGEAVLRYLQDSIPDVLLTDIGMPQMDGYMLLQQIRQRPPEQGGQIPAIALTAYAGALNQQQALAAGFQLHLPKPVDPDELIQAIARLGRSPG